MTITRILTGTLEQMKDFFDKDNSVRFYEPTKDNKFKVTLRVIEDFIEPKHQTIALYKIACKEQG